MKNNRYINWLLIAVISFMSVSMMSCDDQPDKYEIADGTPTVNYIKSPNVASKDSLLTGAYMANTICIVGSNLRSITELYFNDQQAILNTSYMTDNTLIVDVPRGIPTDVTNKIYMHNNKGVVTDYDFKVLVPAPNVMNMSCEYATPGSIATITGD